MSKTLKSGFKLYLVWVQSTMISFLSSADMRFPKDNQNAETRSRERTELLQWISKLDFTSKQTDILSRRSPNTGTWLLKDEKFQQWLGGERHSCLWCPGIRKYAKAHLTKTRKTDETLQLARARQFLRVFSFSLPSSLSFN